jgi:hypothetical protein
VFNFIITGTCSKGCSFCFTEEVARLKHSLGEMSVDQLNKLLDYYEFSPIKGEFSDVRILGGEPTQHSNFQGIADAVILRGLKINLVSNFLFGETTKEYIVNKIRGFRWMLPNSAELNEKNRLQVWKTNYLAIYNAYQSTWGFEDSARLYLSITISKDFESRKHFDYIKWLYKELKGKVNGIRIGLDLTGTYLINNKALGKELDKIINFCSVNNIRIVSDCQVPPCLWEGKTREEVVTRSRNFATFSEKDATTCGFLPIDVFPDGSSTQCYPLKNIVNVNNLLNMEGENKIKSLTTEYEKEYLKNSKRYSVPEDCQSCVFYLNGCNGICAGCLQGGKNA